MKATHAAALGLTLFATPAFAQSVKVTGNVTDVFGTRFVLESPTGKYLVEVGPKGRDKFKLKAGDKIDVEGNAKDRELRARRVTLSDGQAYEVGRKKNRSWSEWLTGKPAQPASPFTADAAKKQATDKGYAITGDAKPIMKHFRTTATKDGKPYELDIHRDGRIIAMAPFGIPEAKKLATDKGYELVGDPRPVDQHFELLAKKDAKYYELQAHRNGRLDRGRLVEANDDKWKSVIR